MEIPGYPHQTLIYDYEEHKMNDDAGGRPQTPADMAVQRVAANGPGRRDMAGAYRRAAGLAVLVAAAAIGLAACSGGSSTPLVASLGTSSGNGSGSPTATGNSTAALANGNPTQLLDEWAACMRSHGDPSQPDPTIDANKVIHVTIPADAPKGVMGSSGANTCSSYMTAAQTALRGGKPPEKPDQAQLVKFAECMRANGIPDFPDPTAGGFSLQGGGDLSPNNPTFQNASKVCAKQTGMQGFDGGTPQPGTVIVRTSAMEGGSGTNG